MLHAPCSMLFCSDMKVLRGIINAVQRAQLRFSEFTNYPFSLAGVKWNPGGLKPVQPDEPNGQNRQINPKNQINHIEVPN